MIELVECSTVGVFGPVASGKTFLLKQWLSRMDRVVVYDATGEMFEDETFTTIWSSPKQLLETIERSPFAFRVAYQPGGDITEDFSWTLKILWQFDAPRWLAIDECHLVMANNSIESDVEMMLRFSRHAKLGLVGMSQRIADVHKLFTSACRKVVLFWTAEARDLDAINSRWGNQVSETVAALRPLIYSDSTQTVEQIPQCVVLQKGDKPKVYDFQTETLSEI